MANANPKWWTDKTTSGWERAKEAMRRDWEQTKSDFGKDDARDLDQDVDDTVKQAAGKQPIPPAGAPNWDQAEPAVRYGWGAAHQYHDHVAWNDKVENKLSEEWDDLKTGRTWQEMKSFVRRGWESARRKVKAA